MVRTAITAAFVGWLFASPVAVAADLPEQAGAARTVAMFDIFCFSQVPDIDAIANIAKGNFDEVVGEERQKFAEGGPPGELRVWKYVDFDQEYVLTTLQSRPDEAMKAEVPQFADATSYACSLLLPRQDPAVTKKDPPKPPPPPPAEFWPILVVLGVFALFFVFLST